MVRVAHSYKLSVLKRTSEELRVLERVVQGVIRDLCQSVTQPEVASCRRADFAVSTASKAALRHADSNLY